MCVRFSVRRKKRNGGSCLWFRGLLVFSVLFFDVIFSGYRVTFWICVHVPSRVTLYLSPPPSQSCDLPLWRVSQKADYTPPCVCRVCLCKITAELVATCENNICLVISRVRGQCASSSCEFSAILSHIIFGFPVVHAEKNLSLQPSVLALQEYCNPLGKCLDRGNLQRCDYSRRYKFDSKSIGE